MLLLANVASTKRRLALVAIVVRAHWWSAPAACDFVHMTNMSPIRAAGRVRDCLHFGRGPAVARVLRLALFFVPEGSTAADCLDEMVVSSNSQNGLDAIHNYDTQAVADALAGKNYTTCTTPKTRSPARTPRTMPLATTGENTALSATTTS